MPASRHSYDAGMPRSWRFLAFGTAVGVVAVVAAFTLPRLLGPAAEGPATSSAAERAGPPPSTPVEVTSQPAPTTTTAPTPTTTVPPTTTTTTLAPDSAVLAGMSLEQKVGQVFMVEVHGVSATAPSAASRRANERAYGVETAAEVVTAHHVGGVIYFGRNVANPEQVAAMSAALQQAAGDGSGVGLLIATDQEGGRVNRVREPATVFPAARVFGDIARADLTESAARVSAIELRAMGINQVLAPVADVAAGRSGVIGERAFGADPALVAEQVAAAVRGYDAGRVAATPKHFPGHGGTRADSHVTLPVLGADAESWAASDLRPFAGAVAAGAPAVMVGHLALPAIDPSGAPATLSRPLITGELRGRLGFDGVVITDSLSMEGVRAAASDGEVAVQALAAGADLLLMPFDFDTAYEAVLTASRSDPAFAARLDEAVARVLGMKQALGVLEPPAYDPVAVSELVAAPAHRAVLDEVRAAATTVPSQAP